MKLEDYELLLHLNDYGTIRATAKKILISQPALTQRLKYIEEYFGGLIYLRTSKKLVPTPLGEMVLEHAESVIGREKQLHDQLSKAKGGVAGTVYIGASSLFSQRFLPNLLQSFTKKYPDVTIDLVTGVSEEIKYSADHFHVSIVRGERLKGHDCSCLFQDPLYLFDSSPLGKSRNRPFIEFKSDPGFHRLIEQWMLGQNLKTFKRSIKVDQFETAKQMMKRGLGMTVLPGSISRDEVGTYDYLPLTVDGVPLVRETWACVKPGLRDLPQVDAFLRHLENIILES